MSDLYQLLLENIFQEKKEEKFKLGTCCFETDTEIDPLEFIKQNNFFGYSELENLHFLFSKLPIFYFDPANRHLCKPDSVFKEIYFMVCIYDDIYNWNCHQAAPYFSAHNPNWDYLIGFTQQQLSSGKIFTFLHSFNAKGNIFVDPTAQSRYELEAKWVNQGIWEKTNFKPHDLYRYMGIKFPTSLAKKIVFGEKDTVGNIWGYLLKNVLISKEKTKKFAQALKNGTEWVA